MRISLVFHHFCIQLFKFYHSNHSSWSKHCHVDVPIILLQFRRLWLLHCCVAASRRKLHSAGFAIIWRSGSLNRSTKMVWGRSSFNVRHCNTIAANEENPVHLVVVNQLKSRRSPNIKKLQMMSRNVLNPLTRLWTRFILQGRYVGMEADEASDPVIRQLTVSVANSFLRKYANQLNVRIDDMRSHLRKKVVRKAKILVWQPPVSFEMA